MMEVIQALICIWEMGMLFLCCIPTAATKKDACDHQDYLVDMCGVGYGTFDISKTYVHVFPDLFVICDIG